LSSSILISSRMTPCSRARSSGERWGGGRGRSGRRARRDVLVEDLDVEADGLFAGEGVEVAADGVDLAGDLLGGAGGGALEDHVLDEVGDAVDSAASSREPESIQTPMETERRCGMRSVRTSRPLGRTVRRMLRGVEAVEAGGVSVADIFLTIVSQLLCGAIPDQGSL
jgi:hypothetical protein